jgi:hypothetical protein
MPLDSITLVIAVWGACLGTIGTIISLVLAVREFRRDRTQIRINVEISNNDPFWLITGTETKTYIVVSVLNAGFRPSQVKFVLLGLSNGKTINNGKLIKDELPKILIESQSLDVYFDVSELRKLITSRNVTLKFAHVFDAAGNKWKYRIPKQIRQMV